MHVALIIEDAGPSTMEIVRELRKLCVESLSPLRESVTSARPVFVRPLFSRADPEFAKQLLSLLRRLEARSVAYKLYQILDGQRFDAAHAREYYLIDAARLATIILARDESLEQQRAIGRLQDGADD